MRVRTHARTHVRARALSRSYRFQVSPRGVLGERFSVHEGKESGKQVFARAEDELRDLVNVYISGSIEWAGSDIRAYQSEHGKTVGSGGA